MWISSGSFGAPFGTPFGAPLESPVLPNRFGDGLCHEPNLLLTIDIHLHRLGSRNQRLDAYRELRDQLLARIEQRFAKPAGGNE